MAKDTDEDRAKKYAKMVRKWSPAGRRMQGQELIEWRREQYRSVLARNGLSSYFNQFDELASKSTLDDRTAASRRSHAARYHRAYGR